MQAASFPRSGNVRISARIATVLGALLLAILTPLLTVAPAEAATAAATYQSSAFGHTNDERTDRDRKALRQGACLQKFATSQARLMAAKEQMFHQPLVPVLTGCGLTLAGENVGYGFNSGRAIVNAWMKSPAHRANILERGYRLMAIGASRGDDGLWYVAQVFGRK